MKRKVASLLCIVMMLSASVISLSGCQKEKEISWWKDFENLEFIFEDERSQEKSFSYKYTLTEKIEFNYIQEKGNTVEYMPKVKILHKGEEKVFYTRILKREKFSRYPGGFVDYDNPQTSVIVKEYGVYRVTFDYYSTKENADNYARAFSSEEVYIIIHKGEEQ